MEGAKHKQHCAIWIGITIIIVFVLIPVLLNIFLDFNLPCRVPVIGQPTDWLTFWGSYLGGIISAIIGFVTLLFTIKQNRLAQQIQLKKDYIEELANGLALRIQQFDYPQLFKISLKDLNTISHDEVQEEIDQLNLTHSQLSNLADSWGIVHGGETLEEARQFNEHYLGYIEAYKKMIKVLTAFYKQQQSKITGNQPFDSATLNNMLVGNREGLSKRYDELFIAASAWVRSEQLELQKLIDEHKDLL